MKKITKSLLTLLSICLLISACSKGGPVNPVVGTVPEDEIPSEPSLHHRDIPENIEELRAACPFQSFTGVNGETVTINDAYWIEEFHYVFGDQSSDGYYCSFDFGFINYTTPIYKRGEADYSSTIDNEDELKEYSEYYKNKSRVYAVKRGDKLENGLICTYADTSFIVTSEGTVLGETEACFAGELTLTGTIYCEQEEDSKYGKGFLSFVPDSDNGNVPGDFEVDIPNEVNIGSYKQGFDGYYMRPYVTDIPEEYASLIRDNEKTDVEITLKDIKLRYSSGVLEAHAYADLVDLKLI